MSNPDNPNSQRGNRGPSGPPRFDPTGNQPEIQRTETPLDDDVTLPMQPRERRPPTSGASASPPTHTPAPPSAPSPRSPLQQPSSPQDAPLPQPIPPAPVHATAVQKPKGEKSPGLAAFLSFIWPGLGQIYNGSVGLGIILSIVNIFNAFLLLFFVGFLTGFITWIFAIVHAHNEAKEHNRLHGYA